MFEDEKNLDGVENDDPGAPDDTTETKTAAQDMTDEELSAALKAVKDTPAKTEDTPKTEAPKIEEKPAETKTETPPVDIEAEVEKRLTAKRAELEAEWTKREQEKVQKAVDSVIAKERKRDDSARKALRDFEARYGMTIDKAAEANREARVQQLVTEKGWDEADARQHVALQEEQALARARAADEENERKEFVATNTYRQAKLDFVADSKQPDIYKKALQKFGTEIDQFSDFGRGVDFMVALKYVAGDHLAEIQAELAAEYEAKLAAKAQEIETVRKATEQKVIRDTIARSKAAPETSTAGVAPPEASLTPMEIATARAFGMTPSQYAKAKNNVNPRSKS